MPEKAKERKQTGPLTPGLTSGRSKSAEMVVWVPLKTLQKNPTIRIKTYDITKFYGDYSSPQH